MFGLRAMPGFEIEIEEAQPSWTECKRYKELIELEAERALTVLDRMRAYLNAMKKTQYLRPELLEQFEDWHGRYRCALARILRELIDQPPDFIDGSGI